ncbi:AraC family transcriptional regulator [Gordonia sp. OPL2]|uniref:helix-turn-helix transcriptional regulator n=1 Tax=Gordonia sp. OPL2 TaxID=2486274 RepID=UPI001656641F|nr:AraC family transcriptional regulator [Gordonia sp. OPL2]
MSAPSESPSRRSETTWPRTAGTRRRTLDDLTFTRAPSDESDFQNQHFVQTIDGAGAEGRSTRLPWPGVQLHHHGRPDDVIIGSETSPVVCFAVRGHLHLTSPIRAFVPGPDWGIAVPAGAECAGMALGGSRFRRHLALSIEIPIDYARRAAKDVRDGCSFTQVIAPDSDAEQHAATFSYGKELRCALARFVHALDSEEDRRVLAPLYFEEITHLVYRLPVGRRAMINSINVRKEDDPIHRAVRYMRSNLTDSIGVTDLAREVSLSQSAFSHLFRSSTGTTPYQYLKNVRLDTAKTMLVNEPSMAVADVAQAVGYHNPSHFISEFKRKYRVTPREFARISR